MDLELGDKSFSDENSDPDLTIVTESPKSGKKSRLVEPNPEEMEIIEDIGKDLEEALKLKAAKSNLTTVNVKNIIKQVVSNKHVIALVQKAANPDLEVSDSVFEPTLTRAKAKELLSTNSTSLPWLTPTRHSSAPWLTPTRHASASTSEVQKLITEELDEDSSGDDYVPGEESEDDRDSSLYSEGDIRSVSPPTPSQIPESPQEVQWTDDGIFKIPLTVTQTEVSEEETANIALRTRSKLSLSSTPLEVIEEAFIPPDITTDMYDMECDDDDWRDFLKTLFSRPLDEVAKPTDDEDHDPEYNILADENINEVDTEELRADKAVKVTRKELNELVAALFDDLQNDIDESTLNESTAPLPEPTSTVLLNPPSFDTASTTNLSTIEPSCTVLHNPMMQVDQKLLLEQQMRQHVQMLTQNFILTYQYPEFHGVALKVREFLLNLLYLSGSNEQSAFHTVNLKNALALVANWENQFTENTEEMKNTKEYAIRVQQEAKQCWAAGTEYILTFPPLTMKTIANSDVFIYPNLLPRIPFKSGRIQESAGSCESEEHLLALGLEQFIPYLKEEPQNLTPTGEVKLKVVSTAIANYMMPSVPIMKIYNKIRALRGSTVGMNPVKYYFQHEKAPVTMHYVATLAEFGVVPPCKRSKSVLPYQWRNYIYPEAEKQTSPVQTNVNSLTKIVKPPAFNKCAQKANSEKKASPEKKTPKNLNTLKRLRFKVRKKTKSIFCSTPKGKGTPLKRKLEEYFRTPKLKQFQKKSCLTCLKFNSSIFRNLSKKPINVMKVLPSMPVLASSSNSSVSMNSCNSQEVVPDTVTNSNPTVEVQNTVITVEEDEPVVKDTEEAAVSVASSSSIKTTVRKSLSGAEKKKAKLCREYNATLTMLTPEDPRVVQERAQSYAQAYFEKARDHLNPQDYERFMEILNDCNDGTSNVVGLYKQMEVLLASKHPDLLEEFVTFLTPSQARDIGKLMLYYKLNNMSLFLHKMETYFKDQPAHIRKIYRSLTELSTCVDVTMDRVKNLILPLLKGNGLLIDWFLQIFPNEPPPKSLLSGPWEQLDIRSEFLPSKDLFETVTVPDDEESYGGSNCICSCHQRENTVFKTRLQHCTPCGLKFVQGRVFVQTDKGLRSANVSFPGSTDKDHNQRLNCTVIKKGRQRSEASPLKHLTSPTKEALEEARPSTCDSEDDADTSKKRNRTSRSPRKRKLKVNLKPRKEKAAEVLPVASTSDVIDQPQCLESIVVNRASIEEDNCDITCETPEWDCNTPIESLGPKYSPEHSADSESEFCEESSQDNINTETDDTAEEIESTCNSPVHSENSNSNTFVENMWTREEDKIILETLQKTGNMEDYFVSIASELSYRTVADIKDRFNTLMTILQKVMSSGSSNL